MLAATLLAAVLHVIWWQFLATDGGDMAAQDAWAGFAGQHPGSAYDLAWYGGMHPASYSLVSPYVMAVLGVRFTIVVAGTASVAMLAILLVRSGIRRPLLPAMYGAVALSLDAVSGRVTFGLGSMFALATVVLLTDRDADPPARWRKVSIATLAALATASSPVAGLFLGVIAAALLLQRRYVVATLIGLPPVVVVGVSAWLFPFSGEQPWSITSAILPVVISVAVAALAPAAWRTVRLGAVVYAAGVVVLLFFPNEIGSNVSRLALLYGGVLLVAALASHDLPERVAREPRELREPRPERVREPRRRAFAATGAVGVLTAAAILVSSTWQVGLAAGDVAHTRVPESAKGDFAPLIAELDARGAEVGRVEVVPLRSHREAAALPDYVNLARGWNRQADIGRDPIFYEPDLLTPQSYEAWLHRMAVQYVAVPSAELDPTSGVEEAQLVATGPGYLHLVWSNPDWKLYAVSQPTALADHPATLVDFDSDQVTLIVARPGRLTVRIQYSPWLTLTDGEGCLSPVTVAATATEPAITWTQIRATRAGLYRLTAPYHLPRGTPCPTGTDTAAGSVRPTVR